MLRGWLSPSSLNGATFGTASFRHMALLAVPGLEGPALSPLSTGLVCARRREDRSEPGSRFTSETRPLLLPPEARHLSL
jgi:hypothetical protein